MWKKKQRHKSKSTSGSKSSALSSNQDFVTMLGKDLKDWRPHRASGLTMQGVVVWTMFYAHGQIWVKSDYESNYE